MEKRTLVGKEGTNACKLEQCSDCVNNICNGQFQIVIVVFKCDRLSPVTQGGSMKSSYLFIILEGGRCRFLQNVEDINFH